MNHLQSTMMEMILSKPTFAGTIPEVSPQPSPMSPPSARPWLLKQRHSSSCPWAEVKETAKQPPWSEHRAGKHVRAPRKGGWERFEMGGSSGEGLCHSLEFLDSTISLFYVDRSRPEKWGSFRDNQKERTTDKEVVQIAGFSSRYWQALSLRPTLMTTPYKRQTFSRCLGAFVCVFSLSVDDN